MRNKPASWSFFHTQEREGKVPLWQTQKWISVVQRVTVKDVQDWWLLLTLPCYSHLTWHYLPPPVSLKFPSRGPPSKLSEAFPCDLDGANIDSLHKGRLAKLYHFSQEEFYGLRKSHENFSSIKQCSGWMLLGSLLSNHPCQFHKCAWMTFAMVCQSTDNWVTPLCNCTKAFTKKKPSLYRD